MLELLIVALISLGLVVGFFCFWDKCLFLQLAFVKSFYCDKTLQEAFPSPTLLEHSLAQWLALCVHHKPPPQHPISVLLALFAAPWTILEPSKKLQWFSEMQPDLICTMTPDFSEKRLICISGSWLGVTFNYFFSYLSKVAPAIRNSAVSWPQSLMLHPLSFYVHIHSSQPHGLAEHRVKGYVHHEKNNKKKKAFTGTYCRSDKLEPTFLLHRVYKLSRTLSTGNTTRSHMCSSWGSPGWP